MDEPSRPAGPADAPGQPPAAPDRPGMTGPTAGTAPAEAAGGATSPAGTPPALPTEPAPADEPTLLDRLPLWTSPAILAAVPLLVWLASLWNRALVYDRFVWRYYWGPIKADALNRSVLVHNGIEATSGYNYVNTVTWALLLGVGIFGVAQMLRRFRTPMDGRLVLAATSWVVAGSIFHVLEDAGLLGPPLQYFFITPIIYLLFAAFGILSFLMGQYLDAVARRAGVERALQKLWMLLAAPIIVWLLLWLEDWGQVRHYLNPVVVALFVLVSYAAAVLRTRRAGRIDPSGMVLDMSYAWLLAGFAYIAWFVRDPWTTPSDNAMPEAFLLAPSLALLVVLVVRLVARARLEAQQAKVAAAAAAEPGAAPPATHDAKTVPLADPNAAVTPPGLPAAAAFLLPVNLLVIFSQCLDAFATALGIDLADYEEKHVLSAAVIDRFRDFAVAVDWGFGAEYATFLSFVPLKLLLSLGVVYLLDVQSREDAQRNPTLFGLVKFAIIMVGIGPGVRDFARLSIGV